VTRAAVLAAVLLATSGCLPKAPFVPTPESGVFEDPDDGAFTVALPSGWMRANDDEAVFITREGPTLQHIVIMRDEIDEPLKGSKRKLSRDMETYEIAELIAGEISSSEGVTGVKILDNAPAQLGGVPGFRLLVAYKDADGLKMKSLYYGAVTEKSLWSVQYTAPARVYYDRDVATFQRVVASFKLRKDK
jgi:hypothetical protein